MRYFLKKKKKKSFFFKIDEKVAGEGVSSKINRLCKIFKKKNQIAFLYQLQKMLHGYLILGAKIIQIVQFLMQDLLLIKKKMFIFFSDQKKIKKIKHKINYKKIQFYSFENFYDVLSKLNSSFFAIDKLTCSIFYQSLINSKFKINYFEDPIYHLKSIKNKIEIENMKSVHIKDGVALTKFLYWIKQKKILDLMKCF